MQTVKDASGVSRLIDEIAAKIRKQVGAHGGGEAWALLGVRSHGDVIAQRLATKLKDIVGSRVGTLDITLYRDDLSEVGATTVVRPTEVDFDIAGLNVVLVDDVIQTGRSARSALEAISDLGRPRRVWFCVLVDRGGRELPIQPDIVGLDLSNDRELAGDAGDGSQDGAKKSDKSVFVQLTPTDSQDQILIDTRPEKR